MKNNQCLKYFLNLLKTRDYSKKTLIDKARAKNYLDSEVQESIEYLLNKNFVNDLRLAKNLVQKYRKEKGVIWIKQKLKAKGVSEPDIETALQSFDTDQFLPDTKLKKKIELKYKIDFKHWDELEERIKIKINSFLQTRGYFNSLEIIQNWKREG